MCGHGTGQCRGLGGGIRAEGRQDDEEDILVKRRGGKFRGQGGLQNAGVGTEEGSGKGGYRAEILLHEKGAVHCGQGAVHCWLSGVVVLGGAGGANRLINSWQPNRASSLG
jgi:hypothetical protein